MSVKHLFHFGYIYFIRHRSAKICKYIVFSNVAIDITAQLSAAQTSDAAADSGTPEMSRSTASHEPTLVPGGRQRFVVLQMQAVEL